ncbi:spore cortex biosynthesis protein YabQ [Candidatus Clostridium stratigraminis]|uniref:Spore cortex biosynthesis protein YabQ n=1 Tax=Candidatus Clostridium stratigraminis TaxID=3381661 RepID=A0ABW8T6G9_9CLOT
MLFSVSTQFNLLIFSLLAGVITGILFDLYRVMRGINDPNKIITFIEDTLFWIFVSIIIFIFLLYMSYAYMRGYVYISIAVGIIIYMSFISKYFIKLLYRVVNRIAKIIRVSFILLLYPFNLLIYKLKRKNK